QLEILPKRTRADILEVHADPVREGYGTAAADLPEASQTGRYIQAPPQPALTGLGLRARQRPRADQRHISTNNIPELRQLIQAGFAQNTTQGSHARILFDLERRPVLLIKGHEIRLPGLGVNHHGAELVHQEGFSAPAAAQLLEKDRAARGAPD